MAIAMPRLSPGLAEQRQGLLKEHLGPGLVAARDARDAEADLRVAKLGPAAVLPLATNTCPWRAIFLRMAAEPPVLPGQPRSAGSPARAGPGPGARRWRRRGYRARLPAGQPGQLAGAFQPRPGGLGEVQEMGRMPIVRLLPLAALAQPFAGVLADSLQQRRSAARPARSASRIRLASTRELSVSMISSAWSWPAAAEP